MELAPNPQRKPLCISNRSQIIAVYEAPAPHVSHPLQEGLPVENKLVPQKANVRRSFWIILLALIATATPILHAQQTAAPTPAPPAAAVSVPAFDVISVKPNNTAAHGMMLNYTPDGLNATNIPVQFLFHEAFGLNDDQIFGAPGWAQSIHYDVDAKVNSADVPALHNVTHDQRRAMLLQILTERFKLTYHREPRILPVYALVVAKGGSKLDEFKAGNDTAGEPKHPGRMQMQNTTLTAEGVPIAPLASLLSSRLGRPVEDKTGLTGIYNFKLQWADERHEGPPRGPDAALSADAPPPEPSGPSIFTAIEEQLGLKLESAKGPVQVLLIDHIEPPTQN